MIGAHCGKWCCWEVFNDTALLQRHLYRGEGRAHHFNNLSISNFTLTRQAYKKTIGVDFLEKKLKSGGEDLRLMIWDTAGQEEFDSMTKAYYRGKYGGEATACLMKMEEQSAYCSVACL